MKVVGKPFRKKDAMQLVTGKPVYMDDLAPANCLCVKLLKSPHANAYVKAVKKKEIAMKIPGIECIFTWEDIDQEQARFTCAGQSSPEPSPRDRLLLDRHVRFVGDPVAIVAGETEEAVDKALKMLKVEYEILPAILDMHDAKDSEILIHPEDNWLAPVPVGADNKRNLVASECHEDPNLEEVMADCEVVLKETYQVQANQQTAMETFRTTTYIDTYGRLVIFSSTQIIFHVRRIISNALKIPKSKIRVIKPRIGGGFGSKQTVVTEIYPALVTWKTGKPAKLIYTRVESQTLSSPRHQMEVTVRLGGMKDGRIRALDVYTLSNSGAYGEHGPTTVGLSGHKSIPLYGSLEAHKFAYDVVYTNRMSAGAYRGYGATQGQFAVESIVNQFAAEIGRDPVEIRYQNMVREGQIMPAYYNQLNDSCTLDKCMDRAVEMIGWKDKFPAKDMGNGKIRSVGVAMSMQGSGIDHLDIGSITLKLTEDGGYNMLIGAADMGTGCDTTLAQVAAEVLECELDDIAVYSGDTDSSPYDSGSYASSTMYTTGKAAEKTAREMRKRIMSEGRRFLGMEEASMEEFEFNGKTLTHTPSGKSISIAAIAECCQAGNDVAMVVTESNCSPVSPPPFMVGMVEIELDKETGSVEILDYVAVVDCGTPINPNITRVQTEGGLVQGIGMALYENVSYTAKGKVKEDSFLSYKIPTRLDMGKIRVEFMPSYEETGPFGAKSIGEIVINTPSPALAHAIYNATGVWHRTLPITSEKIAMSQSDL
ncbi:MAG: molybdopterin-dependent oxidoreductase [Dorea sp.]|nr:molybdopterin-dependent oxidoreductase [Dorea sp.]